MPKLRWTLASFTAAAALAAVSTPAQAQSCGDPWLTQAIRESFNRAPQGNECNINRYGGGRWSNYAQLKRYVQLSTQCKDPWIAQAHFDLTGGMVRGSRETGACNPDRYAGGKWSSYTQLRDYVKLSSHCDDPWIAQAYSDLGRSVVGRGTSSECNVDLYGGGRWASYADLKAKIQAHQNAVQAAKVSFTSSGGLKLDGKTYEATDLVVVATDGTFSDGNGKSLSKEEAQKKVPELANLVGNSGNTLVGNNGNTLLGKNGARLIGTGSASLVAVGSLN